MNMNMDMEVKHHEVEHFDTVIDYLVGTRVTTLKLVSETETNYLPEGLVAMAIEQFQVHYSHTGPRDDLFVTIAWTTFEVIIEVSDRMKDPT